MIKTKSVCIYFIGTFYRFQVFIDISNVQCIDNIKIRVLNCNVD